jgi:hypothetical protein
MSSRSLATAREIAIAPRFAIRPTARGFLRPGGIARRRRLLLLAERVDRIFDHIFES